MLRNSKAFGGYSVKDVARARAFYERVLGVRVEENEMGILELHVGDGMPFILYPKPNHEPATFTVLNFPVKSIEKAVDELASRGVTFEQYGPPIKTDEKGIFRSDGNGPNIAWFRDVDGNILSVIEDDRVDD